MDPVYRQMLSELWAPKPAFTIDDLPDQTGRVAIVTGSNVGIGKETAKVLLQKNCKVYVAARSEEKARAAIEDLIRDTGKNNIHYLQLDLGDLPQVKKAADEFKSKENKLHLLFNNAGVMATPPDMRTKQGYEEQLGVNVVGPFLFTKLLLPLLLSTAESVKNDPSAPHHYNVVRVINTSSNGHAGAPPGGFNFDDPNHLKSKWAAYGQSKWSNIVVADEIAKRYGGKGITAHSLNPGVIKTELTRYGSFFERAIIQPIAYPTPMGALTQLYAGLMPETGKPDRNGLYFIPFGREGVRRKDTQAPGVGEKLWNWLEKETAPYSS